MSGVKKYTIVPVSALAIFADPTDWENGSTTVQILKSVRQARRIPPLSQL
jgi:hypothetical protein